MIAVDETALICDLAETYHIYDYKSLPLTKVATFSVGLRDDSRIKLKMNNMRCSLKEMLLATIADKLSMLVWMNSEDGQKGNNRPISILATLFGDKEEKSNVAFDTPEDFENAKKKIIEGSDK